MKPSRLPLVTLILVLVFFYLPIGFLVLNSFNDSRFSSKWNGFSLRWYQEIAVDPTLPPAIRNTLLVGVCASVLSTLLGFGAAYTDFRYRFFGKAVYLALALLPPTIPVVILGLAMLVFLSQVSLFGALHSVVISHVVFCLPFAMALVRLRLSQMDQSLEAAAWNLGASQWRALREVILPFVLALVLAYVLTPLVAWCERHKMPRAVAIIAVYVVTLGGT